VSLTCTRCDGSGFLNLWQIPGDVPSDDHDVVVGWIAATKGHDVAVCDCCGDGEGWHGTPGEHYGSDDPPGHNGPYSYNGGFCECH